MLTDIANGRLSLWRRVRAHAVPPSMIGTATARREAGDWAGACAAARVDVDLDLRTLSRRYGRDFAALLRSDLRRLAPDLLRWHLPRIAPDGLLRPGLTVPLVHYDVGGGGSADGLGAAGRGRVSLVVRTDPAWADAGQRLSLALWDPSARDAASRRHPHPSPSRRHRLDLHRHLWDATRSGELPARSTDGRPPADRDARPEPLRALPSGRRYDVGRWADEAGLLLEAEGHGPAGSVLVRLGGRDRMLLDVARDGAGSWRITDARRPRQATAADPPVLPDAATWVPPDRDLLAAGLVEPHALHPLVAAALAPGHLPAPAATPARRAEEPGVVDCRGALHRIGQVDGVLAPLDHDPVELRREALLVALGGPPLPCLRAVDEALRTPECLPGVRERLAHGDADGALEIVTTLLGPQAVLREGELLDTLAAAVDQRIVRGLYRAGLSVSDRLDGAPRHVPAAPTTPSHRRAVRRRAGEAAHR
ncbi:hypothetical protein ABT026_31030 [Streptomyces sp. NPDC002734]|uniref:hypothetical protein n=1 Tax=Streptomyces sp. NPDC002734 TaxID=3154426 RepID=UPI00331A1240